MINVLIGGNRSANLRTSLRIFFAITSSFVNNETTPLVPKYINLDKWICLFSNSLRTDSEPISFPEFNALEMLSSLNKACYELPKGADGISKTWEEVDVEASIAFK